MNNNKFEIYTNEQLKNICAQIGDTYEKSVYEAEVLAFSGSDTKNDPKFRNAQEFIYAVDRGLQDCSSETIMIIRNDYLTPVKNKLWYLNYFCRATYYRLSRKAMIEFLNCLRL